MNLHMLWLLLHAHPGKLINALSLMFVLPGSWLLHRTRQVERRSAVAAAEEGTLARQGGNPWLTLQAARRMNRFFYRFGFACLFAGLMVSWLSTRF